MCLLGKFDDTWITFLIRFHPPERLLLISFYKSTMLKLSGRLGLCEDPLSNQ